MKSKQNIALVGISAFFLLLFNAPFLKLTKGFLNGVPLFIYYISVVWIALIVIMIFFSSNTKSN